MIKLAMPFNEQKIRSLKVGDMVLITGKLFTGRDAVHKYLHEGGEIPVSLRDQIIYHCGPVVMKDKRAVTPSNKSGWKITAAGPTTSAREEPYQAEIIRKFGLRGVIGKGGMGEKTKKACQEHGCVYLHAVGGAAQVLAEAITQVDAVHMLEKFGSPEAIWELSVVDFPVVVTIDAHGNSLHTDIMAESQSAYQALVGAPKGVSSK